MIHLALWIASLLFLLWFFGTLTAIAAKLITKLLADHADAILFFIAAVIVLSSVVLWCLPIR